MQIIEQINNQTNNQTLFLEDLTMNNKDTHLAKNAQKTFQLINKNQSLSIFEKEKIINERKIMFIQYELSNSGYKFSIVDIEKNFKCYYEIANYSYFISFFVD